MLRPGELTSQLHSALGLDGPPRTFLGFCLVACRAGVVRYDPTIPRETLVCRGLDGAWRVLVRPPGYDPARGNLSMWWSDAQTWIEAFAQLAVSMRLVTDLDVAIARLRADANAERSARPPNP